MIQVRIVQNYGPPDGRPTHTTVELRDPFTQEVLDRQQVPLPIAEMSEFMVNFYGWRVEILPTSAAELTEAPTSHD